jgi:hypothetical protein
MTAAARPGCFLASLDATRFAPSPAALERAGVRALSRKARDGSTIETDAASQKRAIIAGYSKMDSQMTALTPTLSRAAGEGVKR